MKVYKIAFCIVCVALLASCKKDEKLVVGDIPGLGGDKWVQGPLDTWIKDNYTTPYNIAVKYKWDQFELELNKTLVPPREDKSLAVMQAIKAVWIDTYKAEAGDLFVKKYSPKFFVLVGSVSYDVNAGTETLGTAEGGRKVVLYKVNEFRSKQMPGFVASDTFVIKEMFHTIQHEFGHILHQNIMYPSTFRNITAGLYTANWYNTSVFNARQDGFITDYALSNPDDDFVEMISMMLVEGKGGFDAIVNSITGVSPNGTTAAEAKASLREKEAVVVAYFKNAWNIDFYSLQAKSRAAIEALIK
jgi:substrate import-associated zinc metallohydrolase lipoprotein